MTLNSVYIVQNNLKSTIFSFSLYYYFYCVFMLTYSTKNLKAFSIKLF